MEELLNKLIEKGWKPFGREYVSVEHLEELVRFYYKDKKSCIETLRTMTSKESLLWQFVCENKMVRLDTDSWESDSYLCYYNIDGYPKDDRFEMERDDYRFRLIESALKDEAELEEFLLDNIKVDE